MPQPYVSSKRILVAPLDWGLGHATRCIPIIQELVALQCEVFLGAEGPQAALLKEEFPQLQILPLQGYGIRYARSGRGFGLKMLQQLPRIRAAVRRENDWLQAQIAAFSLQGVISDNRFGLYHPAIPSVIMTHQLRIISPLGKWSEGPLQQVNYHYLENFDQCWVVDFPGEDNLAGSLSHPARRPGLPLRYLGGLSRFDQTPRADGAYDLVVLISGPEPQRSLFETQMLCALQHCGLRTLLISGQPERQQTQQLGNTLTRVSHLGAAALREVLQAAKLVICRAGYSSVMDLIKLRKKAVLVPTPGQTEQEYLGRYLSSRHLFMCVPPADFNLEKVLKQAETFPFRDPADFDMNRYRSLVRHWVASLS
jgi:predicted glycosyltransferase